MAAISLEEAVYKMSGFPATRFRISDRGVLREGYVADLVLFDPRTVTDRATWEEPKRDPTGVTLVMVNGRVVVRDGIPTGVLPGKVLRRAERRAAA
jgi:N-acyl-D-aspartate/D-glutamate deacylase